MKNIIVSQSYTDRDTRSLSMYLNELNKLSVLTREEERDLFLKYQSGDQNQRELLIKHNLRFVVSIAKHYQGQGLAIEDLISEGNIGLIRQISKYDLSKELKFITYQVWWIKQQIMEQLSIHSRSIRLPQNRILELDRIYKFINTYEQEHTYPPALEEIAEYMKLDKKQILNFMVLDLPTVYLSDPLNDNQELIDIL